VILYGRTPKKGARWSDYPAGKSYNYKTPIQPIRKLYFLGAIFGRTFETLNKLINY
jgi:hypothetical protein